MEADDNTTDSKHPGRGKKGKKRRGKRKKSSSLELLYMCIFKCPGVTGITLKPNHKGHHKPPIHCEQTCHPCSAQRQGIEEK